MSDGCLAPILIVFVAACLAVAITAAFYNQAQHDRHERTPACIALDSLSHSTHDSLTVARAFPECVK